MRESAFSSRYALRRSIVAGVDGDAAGRGAVHLEVRAISVLARPAASMARISARLNSNFVAALTRWSAAMPQPNDLSRSLVALDQNSTIIAVVELSQSSWLVGGVVPGIAPQPSKKLEPSPARLLAVLPPLRRGA